MKSLVLSVFISSLALTSAYFSFKNYKVYKVVPSSPAQVIRLQKLQDNEEYDFWTERFDVGSDVRVMVSPAQDEEFKVFLKNEKLNGSVAVTNVQELINDQLKPAPMSRSARLGSYSWDQYHPLDKIHAWLDELESSYPNSVKTISIGKSHGGRDIKGVVIDLRSNRGSKPLVAMIEGGIHAREWISPATVTWVIKEFLTSNNAEVKQLAETFVWHIFPVVNPDGYAYTWEQHRMWRKNRNPANFVSTCSPNADLGNGIDLNRNFDFVWMTIGASSNPCMDTYGGPSGSSELEAQAIMKHVMDIKENGEMIYYFAFHSFSQMILVPYSHVDKNVDAGLLPENYDDMFEIASRGAKKLEERHGVHYEVGTSVELLYPVSGSSFDWVKGVAKVPIVYLFELRDNGIYGFMLPSDQIVSNNEEIIDCLVEMDKVTREKGYYSDGAASIVSSAIAIAFGVAFLAMFR